MKNEYATDIASAPTSDDTVATADAGSVAVTRGMKRPREAISYNDTSITRSYDDDNDDDNEGEHYYSETMKKESQPIQQQEQQQQQKEYEQELEIEPHPYMSLYEPLLFATATDEFHACQLSSSSSSSSPQQQPEEISSSSFAAAKQPPQPQINATATRSIYRAKKRQKMTATTTTTTTQIDDSGNSIAEDSIQSVVDKEDTRMDEGTPNDGHDSHIANNEDDNDDASFNSSDDEAIIERMKLATKKNKKMKSGDDDDAAAAIFDCSGYEAAIDYGHDRISVIRMDNDDDDDDNEDSVWNLQQQANSIYWIDMYHRLVAYKKDHKDTKVPTRYGLDPQLGIWANNQRTIRRNKKMTEERKRLLNSIGFVWEDTTKQKKELSTRNKARWEELYHRLVAYKKEHKHTMVPNNYKDDPPLGNWVNTQRVAHRSKKMTEERKHLLNSIGFVWKSSTKNKASWELMYKRLVAFKKEHKHTMVPTVYKEDIHLGHWARTQHVIYRDKKITDERKRLLNSIGFVWKSSTKNKAPWEEMYQRLVSYKKEHKHTMVPETYKEDPHLGYWILYQRVVHMNKKMTVERKRLLNSIGFVWDLPTRNKAPWEEMYQRLLAYKKEHKDTKVAYNCKEDSKLGYWVTTQRLAHRNKKMTEERKRLLNSIGFVWELSPKNTAAWKEMYQRLVAYNKVHKHTMVPNNYKDDPPLGNWVNTQRVAHRDKKMKEERRRLLNSIGFVWELSPKNRAPWEEMYKRLVAFKKEHKHTMVPTVYKKDIHLGHWARTQHVVYRDKKMKEERKHLLNSIGFVWKSSTKNKAPWEETYQRLVS